MQTDRSPQVPSICLSSSKLNPARIIIRNIRNRSYSPSAIKPISEYQNLSLHEEYSSTPLCLKNHNIHTFYRAKMIDWMIEVTSVFQCSSRTFFYAVKIMDKYFYEQKVSVNAKLLHIIGVVSIMIASKFEDVNNIRLYDAKEKIAHNKFSSEDIRITEQAILKKLGFCINFVTRADFIEEICKEFDLSEEFKNCSFFFARLSMYCYRHLEFKESQIAYCSMMLTAKCLDKEDVASILMNKGISTRFHSIFENFQSDIQQFKETFAGLNSAFLHSKMDLEIIDSSLRINPQ